MGGEWWSATNLVLGGSRHIYSEDALSPPMPGTWRIGCMGNYLTPYR